MVAGKSNTSMLAFQEHLRLGFSARDVYGPCLCSLGKQARKALSSSDIFHMCVWGGE